jgi:hypothetical protein
MYRVRGWKVIEKGRREWKGIKILILSKLEIIITIMVIRGIDKILRNRFKLTIIKNLGIVIDQVINCAFGDFYTLFFL